MIYHGPQGYYSLEGKCVSDIPGKMDLIKIPHFNPGELKILESEIKVLIVLFSINKNKRI